ncbi:MULTISPECIES: histidinol dehydrogenase [unclassified Prosthecochloris]|uniref:histidinol dehydrogenase n=1 Tax=unclassified Prosthecochloris TaxID=2632826 RepID=UPI00223D534D|nr:MULTISPECIES: histidinol dehydrogenase [unclassified Prosthecochloris]UZJ38245.1 histidinol dehydrogenase [Prosthecochloris sp. SCSIO W1103]
MLRLFTYAEEKSELQRHLSRTVTFEPEVREVVQEILTNIEKRGDKALFEYTEKFQGFKPGEITVSADLIEEAYRSADRDFVAILEEAYNNITAFHKHESERSFFYEGENRVILGQRVTPLERVMLYVPGGKAAYPSSLLMNVVPAQVAGVQEIFLTTPCDSEGRVSSHILAAAHVAGIDTIYKFGGAQAVAAFAFGTERVPKVDKITGPGNKYVALAKKEVFGHVSIDSIAGPSEVAVIADDSADPEFIVLDLFAQSEHDPDASSVLITDSSELAAAVKTLATEKVSAMQRGDIIQQALAANGAIVLTKDIREACEVSNMIAPEHLELHVRDSWEILPDLKHAGAIFMGSYSCESVGDYFAGPNHTLPTNGTARFFSPLSVRDFIKHTSLISYSKEQLGLSGEKIAQFADHENLQAHAEAVRARLRKLGR